MAELAEYGVQKYFDISLPKQGSSDFAVGADWIPATGDVKLWNGSTEGNLSTLPTAVTGGLWRFTLLGTELQAKCVTVKIIDVPTKAVMDNFFRVETFGHPTLAQYAMNFNLRNDALKAIYYGTVTGAATLTTLVDSGLVAADIDFYKGRILLPTSGTQRFQASKINAFAPGTDLLTFDAMTVAMQTGDTYAIC
jgi:hypothetical protein